MQYFIITVLVLIVEIVQGEIRKLNHYIDIYRDHFLKEHKKLWTTEPPPISIGKYQSCRYFVVMLYTLRTILTIIIISQVIEIIKIGGRG